MKKPYIYSIIAILVVGGALLLNNKYNSKSNPDALVSGSPDSTLAISSNSPQAAATAKGIKQSPKPTPGIIISDIASYADWVKWLEPKNRRLTLDKDCTSIVPSQVDYPNNVEVMLDNTASAKSRILKIGSREYSLDAHSWIITTLSSSNLPAQLLMFCGSMELGRLDLR